jgi:hypothetical protein
VIEGIVGAKLADRFLGERSLGEPRIDTGSSAATGLTRHTLRYNERVGLAPRESALAKTSITSIFVGDETDTDGCR